jgi:hypothetical protein
MVDPRDVIAYRTPPRRWTGAHPTGVLVVIGILSFPGLVYLFVVAWINLS